MLQPASTRRHRPTTQQQIAKWPAITAFDAISAIVVLSPTEPVTIIQLPGVLNMVLYRGDSFAVQLTALDDSSNPVDLSGMQVDAQIRSARDDPYIIGTFESTIFGAAVRLDLTPDLSAQMPSASVWDVQIIDQYGSVATLATGTITMMPDVTRLEQPTPTDPVRPTSVMRGMPIEVDVPNVPSGVTGYWVEVGGTAATAVVVGFLAGTWIAQTSLTTTTGVQTVLAGYGFGAGRTVLQTYTNALTVT